MPYSTKLEAKIDGLSAGWTDLAKKKMFGGICYLLKGNMCFGIWKDFLIVRMGKEAAVAALEKKHVRPFAITGTAMAGWVLVEEGGWKSAAGLAKWLAVGKAFALTLPEKKTGGKKRKTKALRDYRA